MSKPARPLVRYHGGKWKLAPWILQHLPQHRVYVEPFGGGGSVLLRKHRSYAEVYNDLDGEMVNLFCVARDRGEALAQLLELTPFARAEFALAYEPSSDPIEQARRTVIRAFMGFGSAGASGQSTGFRANSNRSGTTPAHDWMNYPDCLRLVVQRLRGVVVENRDALEVMQTHDCEEAAHYVDPPYVHSTRAIQGRAPSYRHELTDQQHELLAAGLRTLRGRVVLSGYRCALYDSLYGDWQRIDAAAHADGARDRVESLWLSPNCPQTGLFDMPAARITTPRPKAPPMPDHTTAPLALLNHLQPSPTNPRRRYAQAGLDSLADSIAAHEVMQPILARPRPDALDGEPPLEIVAGERRWRASCTLRDAGRNPHGQHIPCVVRGLTDAQVLAMQLVENIEREDLHPLDEAQHYQRMLDEAHGALDVAGVAQTGRISEARVRARLQLLQLVPEAREAFLADKLSLATAQQLARMPAHLQAEATGHLSDWGGEPMGPKAAAQFLRTRYMLRLDAAPFDWSDPTLYAAAGSCGACPKRTGANPQLFADISESDVCTDPPCFQSKRIAARERQVAQLQAEGYVVHQGTHATALCTPDGRAFKPGLHAADGMVPANLGDAALAIAEVMTRAKAPNALTQVVDHPGNPVLMYGVATADLEAALKKLKAHRSQIDKTPPAKADKAPLQAKTPSLPGLPAGSAERLAPLASGATSEEPAPAPSRREVAPEQRMHPPPTEDELAAMVDFHVPATSGGLYSGDTPAQFARAKRHTVAATLATAAIGQHLRTDGSEGLPQFGLGQLVAAVLLDLPTTVSPTQAAHMAGIDPASVPAQYADKLHWALALPDEPANRLALLLLAAQDYGHDAVLADLPQRVARLVGASLGGIDDQAEQIVAARMRVAAVTTGKAAAKGKTGKAGKTDEAPE